MKTYSEAAEEFTALIDVLGSDVLYLRELHSRGDGPRLRRHYVRAAMATLEGVAYAFKQMALAAHNDGVSIFSEKEVEQLTEQKVELNEKGVAVTRPLFSSMLPNIKFAFNALARSHDLAFRLPTGESGWQQLSRAVSIRNRITHPKLAAELTINDAEFQSVEIGQQWFMSQAEELASRILEVSQRRLLEKKSEVARGEEALSSLEQERARIEEEGRLQIAKLELERDGAIQRSNEKLAELQRLRGEVMERRDGLIPDLQRRRDEILGNGDSDPVL